MSAVREGVHLGERRQVPHQLCARRGEAGPQPGGARGGRRGEDVPRACSGVSSPCSLLEQSWTQVVLGSLKRSWGAGVVSYRVLSQAAAAQISSCISRAFTQAIAKSNLNPLSDT